MGWDKFEKLVELIKRRITQIVLYKLKDPRLGFVTITKVDLSRDLKLCKVFYTVYGSQGESSRTSHALKDAQGFIQREVGKSLHTRTMPKIQFVEDESIEGVSRVHRILDTLKEERTTRDDKEDPPGEDGE